MSCIRFNTPAQRAQLAAARVTLTRFETLLRQDSIARQEVDTQAATVRQLEAAVVTSKANEGTARLNLGYTRIVAPMVSGESTIDRARTGAPARPSATFAPTARRSVLLPDMFDPLTMSTCGAEPPRRTSLRTATVDEMRGCASAAASMRG